MTETKDLKHMLRDIEKYVKQEQFSIFCGVTLAPAGRITEVHSTDTGAGWKGFLTAAKQAGIKMVVQENLFAGERRAVFPRIEARIKLDAYSKMLDAKPSRVAGTE